MDEDNETFTITPKGIFASVLVDMGLVNEFNDKRIKIAWELFENRMEKSGYVQKDEDENY